MISKKVDIFLKTLAEHITKDSNVVKKPKKLKRGFQLAVSGLKDGKLKEKLLNNLDDCFTELLEIIKQHVKEQERCKKSTAAEKTIKSLCEIKDSGNKGKPATFIYNLYHKKNQTINDENLNQLDQSAQKIICQTYVRCVLPHMNSQTLLDIAAKCQAEEQDPLSWAGQMMTLCTCLLGDKNTESLKAVMKIFNKKYAEVAESTTQKNRILKLVSYGDQFLKMFHFHNQTLNQEFEGRPKYEDYLAGILATHIDCYIQLFHCDSSCCPFSGKELCCFVLSLLGKQHHYGYDVLLQLEKVHSGDGNLILPLARHLLDNVKPRDSCCLYTKYVIAARFVTQWIPSETEDVKQKAFNIPAPGDFLQWIQNFNSGLFDQLPETPHFSGVHITKFLLTDADDDLMQDLFDLLTESYSVETTMDDVQKGETLEELRDLGDADLFVIDKAPDAIDLTEESEVDNDEAMDFETDEVPHSQIEKQAEGTIRFEILTHEEALKMNLVERTEVALERIFDMESEEQVRNSSDAELDDEMHDQEVSDVRDVEGGLNRMEFTVELNEQQEDDQALGVTIQIVDKDVEDGLVTGESCKQDPDVLSSGESFESPIVIEDSGAEDCSAKKNTRTVEEQIQTSNLDYEEKLQKSMSPVSESHSEANKRSPKKRKAVVGLASPLRKMKEYGSSSEIDKTDGLKSPPKETSLEISDKTSSVASESQLQSPRNNTSLRSSPRITMHSSYRRKSLEQKEVASESQGENTEEEALPESIGRKYAVHKIESHFEEEMITDVNIIQRSPIRSSKIAIISQCVEEEEVIDRKHSSPKKVIVGLGSEHLENVDVSNAASPKKSMRSNHSSPRKMATDCNSETSTVTASSLSGEIDQQLTDNKPVSRRLKELKCHLGIPSKREKILSAAEMAKSLKEAKVKEANILPKTYSGRRHSISVHNSDKVDGASIQGGRTQRKAATKAMEMLAILSPRKRRDSLSSVHSVDGNVSMTKSRKKEDSETGITNGKEEQSKSSKSINLLGKKNISEDRVRTCRSSMPPNQLAKTLQCSNSPVKGTPTKKAVAMESTPKRRYSLRTLDKSTKNID